MKRLGRVLGNFLAVALTVFSLQAVAETQLGGRDFNHMTTGFVLSGGHATAACESCHVGGVFKGTPKACDSCHALGRRIVATPKSTSHLVTDAPCETCHFNTSTFLGARYNHGTAIPGQCTTCHNARIAAGKPNSHNIGKKATDSCDHCHRSSAFLPASWNHIGVAPGTCTSCHVVGGQSSISKPASHTPPAIKGINQCDDCHSFVGWLPARFKHNTGAACSSCHNGSIAMGPRADHPGFPGWPTECNQCHFNTISFLGALGAKPANHIPYNAGAACTACHLGVGVTATGAALHANVVTACKTCHNKPTPYLGRMKTMTLGNHQGSNAGQDCTSCHRLQYTVWNKP